MHLLMAFIASTGKLFGDGGVLQLLTLTDVHGDFDLHLSAVAETIPFLVVGGYISEMKELQTTQISTYKHV